MNDVTVQTHRINAMGDQAIQNVRALETMLMDLPQIPIVTNHVFHAGMYARTVMIPAGSMLTGALIKIATLLIVQGEALVYTDAGTITLCGYNVVPASAGRKQAFYAIQDTHLTMILTTSADTVEKVESEFTDETELLVTRRSVKHQPPVIKGE